MRFLWTALLVALTAALTACSSMGPDDGGLPRDVVSQTLSTLAAEEPAYGGIGFATNEVVVYTLGDDAATADRFRYALVGIEDAVEVRPRPPRASATEAFAAEVAAAAGDLPHGVALAPATGHVHVGVWTVYAARDVDFRIRQAGLPLDDVVLSVEDRPELN